MCYISEHDSEKEGKGDTSEDTWVYFFIPWYSVCIDDFLEDTCEFVGFDISRRTAFGRLFDVGNLTWSGFWVFRVDIMKNLYAV